MDAIRATRPCAGEIVVVDDASNPPVAPRIGVRVVRTPGLGRAGARNLGAAVTKSPYLWFVDSDVVVGTRTLTQLWSALGHGAHGAMAVYADDGVGGYAGFRTLYQRFQVLRNPTPRHLSASCVLIGRETFRRLGGFPDLPSMEDVALGLNGSRNACRWISVPSAEVLHLPRARARDVLVRDFFDRGGAAVAILRMYKPHLEHASSLREIVAGLAFTAVVCSLIMGAPGLHQVSLRSMLPAVPFTAWIACEWPWLAFAWSTRGPRFAVTSVYWLTLFRLVIGAGFVFRALRGCRP